ncbi:MAG: hypothetical protein V4819_17375 [Verrucomicrobiota bacterium]
MKIILLLALGISLISVNLQAEVAPKPLLPDIIAHSAFCVAYVIRDADARDARPNDPQDPFPDASGEKIPGGSVLGSDSPIDVAALTSRVTAQARITKDHLAATYKAVIDGQSRFPVMDCYDPHHAIVFYSGGGKPVCCIEICFSCNRVKVAPEFRVLTLLDRISERTDLVALARVFSELKLPLSPFDSFEALKRQKEAQLQKRTPETGQGAASDGTKPLN